MRSAKITTYLFVLAAMMPCHHAVAARRLGEGMHGVKLIVSDSHDGLRVAREATLPGIPWQRCQMHLQQNSQVHITKAHLL